MPFTEVWPESVGHPQRFVATETTTSPGNLQNVTRMSQIQDRSFDHKAPVSESLRWTVHGLVVSNYFRRD